MPRQTLLKASRLVHLYFGVFITPALIFFAFTGAVQTFGLHETNRDHPNYTPAKWLVVLGQIHKKQTPVVNPRKGPGGPAAPADAAAPEHRSKPLDTTEAAAAAGVGSASEHHHKASDDKAPEALAGANSAQPAAVTQPARPVAEAARPGAPPASKHHPLPLRIFFLIVSIGLFTSTFTGLYMAYKYAGNKVAITLTLIAGAVIPVLLTLV